MTITSVVSFVNHLLSITRYWEFCIYLNKLHNVHRLSAEPWQNLKLVFRLCRQPCTPMEADKGSLEQEIMYVYSILLRLVHNS